MPLSLSTQIGLWFAWGFWEAFQYVCHVCPGCLFKQAPSNEEEKMEGRREGGREKRGGVLNPGFPPQPFWDMKAPDGVGVWKQQCVCVFIWKCLSVCTFVPKSWASLEKEPGPNVICLSGSLSLSLNGDKGEWTQLPPPHYLCPRCPLQPRAWHPALGALISQVETLWGHTTLCPD